MRHVNWLAILAAIVITGSTARAETRAIYERGTCNLAGKDDVANRYLKVGLSSRMTYEIRMTARRGLVWTLLYVSNPTDEALYFHCDVAYFDEQNRLVCCTKWRSQVPRAAGRMRGQFSLPAAKVPDERIAAIAGFKVTVHESDKHLGVEPVSAKVGATLPGEKAPAIVKLEEVESEIVTARDYTLFRAQATCSFDDATADVFDMPLPMGPGGAYKLYTSPGRYDDKVFHGTGPKRVAKKIRRWRILSTLEVDKPRQAPRGDFYFVLLDDDGRLVTCGLSRFRIEGYLDINAVPKDRLFSASRIQAVLYTRPMNAQSQ